MSELRPSGKSYGFEEFEVRSEEGTLLRNGYAVSLQQQPFRLLVLLVSRAGTIVTRDEIRAHLWPADTNVEFDKSLRVAVSKLREALRDSAALPTYIETVHRRGYRFIRPVTVSEPPQQEQPGQELSVHAAPLSAVDAVYDPLASPGVAAKKRARPGRVTLWLAVAAVVLLVFGIAERRRWKQGVAPAVAAHSFARHSVAVLGFRNLSGAAKDRWLSTALEEMLSTELSSSERLRVISGEEVARAGLAEPPVNTPSHESLVRYANRLGADIVVFGSYTLARNGGDAAAPQMRLDLRVEDLSSDGPPMSVVKMGRSTDLFSLVSASGSDLRQHFGLGDISPNAPTAVRRTLPSDPDAAQLYAEGLDHLRNFDPRAGRDLLLKAAKVEPGHAGTHLALAEAWRAMGYSSEARAEATRAVELGAGLPREELLTMQGELAVLSHDWPRAIDIYHSLLVLYPDDLEIGLRLVDAQNGAQRRADALASLKSLRRTGMTRADEAKLDLSQATTHLGTGDFRLAVAEADRTIAAANELENRFLRAQALSTKAFTLERLGDAQNALAAASEAQNVYRAENDKKGVGTSLLLSGDLLYDKGQVVEARKDFLSALALFEELGFVSNVGLAQERIGNTYYQEGALAESRKYYEQALASFREVHSDGAVGSAIGNIANVQDEEGDIAGALKSNAECLAIAERSGNKRMKASTLANMGNLEVERGELNEALKDFTQAAAADREIDYARGLSHALVGQGDVAFERNDIPGALKQYELAAKTIEAIDEPEVRIPSQIGQGSAYLLLGDTARAAQDLSKAADTSVKNKEQGLATVSLLWLSRTLLVEGETLKALEAAKQAVAEAEAQAGPQARVLAGMALGRVLLAQGKTAAAQEQLRAAIHAAHAHGYRSTELELRVLLAKANSDARERASQLTAVRKAASAHGWNRIAADAR